MSPAPARRWQLETLDGCALAIGRYPLFRYDARGGGASADPDSACSEGEIAVVFPVERIHIPALTGRTTRVWGVPLPAGLAISIEPEQLEGRLNPETGAVQLHFRAAFRFRVQLGRWCVLAPPDLHIATTLGSGPCQGHRHGGHGEPRNANGEITLVGVASVPPCGAPWLDRFLGLPDEALAVLRCRLTAVQEAAEEADGAPCR